MAPPACYADLTKPIRDLFFKHYHIGVAKLDCKGKSHAGVDFNAVSTVVGESGKSTGFLEVKYKMADYGVTLKEKWLTDNTLNTELICEDRLLQGMKVLSKMHFDPQTNRMTGIVGAAFKNNFYHATTDLDYNKGLPLMNGSIVYAYNNFLVGSLVQFCTTQMKTTKTNVTAGYAGDDLTMLVNMNDFKEFGCSLIHKVKPDILGAVTINWDSVNGKPAEFSIGGSFEISKETLLRSKITNLGALGFSLSHKMRDGIELTMCANFDLKEFAQGQHKLGVGLNLEG